MYFDQVHGRLSREDESGAHIVQSSKVWPPSNSTIQRDVEGFGAQIV